jgi:hypothetical protein
MIPALRNSAAAPHPLYSAFLAELWVRGFAGNLSDAYSDRTVLATDNSIYQMLPQAIAFPSSVDDVSASLDWPATKDFVMSKGRQREDSQTAASRKA